jgi:hypothetical protein
MTDRVKAAKALLGKQQHLIGFTKCSGQHMVQRASSAKVYVPESSPPSDPAKISAVAAPRPARKST